MTCPHCKTPNYNENTLMRICTIDFETFWAQDHTLSKMSPMDYVMHPETELISMAIKFDHYPTDVFFGEERIQHVVNKLDWTDTIVIGHNMSGFDSMILAWRLGVAPKMWGCTLAMARPVHAITVGGSLGKLVAHYDLGVKDNAVLMQTKGRKLADFTPAERSEMETYNKADTDQCYALFNKLKPHYTAKELWHIDATIRMLVDPKFEVNVPMLEAALSIERDQKRKHILMLAKHLRTSDLVEASDAVATAETLDDLEEAVRAELASAPKFSALLTSFGVEVPMKDSPTVEGKRVPALAKTDEGFLALQESDDPLVAAAARARLAVKSTLLETRLQAFIDVAGQTNGKFPVPLNYCGATTTGRWSGCLVADTQVLVYDSITRKQVSKNITDVMPYDLVWDGLEFVEHGGVVFSGYSEVISWDSVTGTENHVVFTDAGEVSLSEARSRGLPIQTGRDPTDYDVDAARAYTHYYKE